MKKERGQDNMKKKRVYLGEEAEGLS